MNLKEAMLSLDFVQWDRKAGPFVFGWISRDDGRSDFVVIWESGGRVGFVSSSAWRHEDMVRIITHGEANPGDEKCVRCEHEFPDVPNVIRLSGNAEHAIDNEVMRPEHVLVDKEVIRRAIESCETAIESTQDLLAEHDASLGRTTRKNKQIAERYTQEIESARRNLSEMRDVLGWPSAETSK